MNRLSIKAISRQLKSLVMMVCVGMLLVLNVACSSPDIPMASGTDSYDEQTGNSGINTDLYEPNQPKRDGMNRYG